MEIFTTKSAKQENLFLVALALVEFLKFFPGGQVVLPALSESFEFFKKDGVCGSVCCGGFLMRKSSAGVAQIFPAFFEVSSKPGLLHLDPFLTK